MLNLSVGSEVLVEGASHIATRPGCRGHAIYGPYQTVEPGEYVVEFGISPAGPAPQDDIVCAVVDVARDHGRAQLASAFVLWSQIESGSGPVRLRFRQDRSAELEYRVHVAGNVPLRVRDRPEVTILGGDDAGAQSARSVLTELSGRHRALLQHLYNNGAEIFLRDGKLLMRLNGITFHAGTFDDINFVDELFFRNAYNVLAGSETCLIDIGMNVGLASLLFAAKPWIREVHAFEPFPNTFARAQANIVLNPELAPKIIGRNIGLLDHDEETTIRIVDDRDSGGMAVRDNGAGQPIRVSLRDAGSVLKPIIASARERGLSVIAKVDCEGSEYAVFESLERSGLFQTVTAFMVEWHRHFEGRDQRQLIEPLQRAGFVVFDVSPPQGNGFFYAVRAERAG